MLYLRRRRVFRSVTVPRRDDSHYPTSFYECAACSVMFLDPGAFNANEPGPPQSAGAKLPDAAPTQPLQPYGKGAPTSPEESAADHTKPI